MTKLLITGARQGPNRSLTPTHDLASMAILDTSTGDTRRVLGHETPRGERAEPPSHAFKAASLGEDSVWVVSLTEVLRVSLEKWAVEERFSHPWFNDLHHVLPRGDRLLVVSTGIDALLEVDASRKDLRVRDALGREPWVTRDPGVDYRLIASTKPHESHPNFVFVTEHGVWLTRFEQRDAVCLDDPQRRLSIEVGNPHDGIVCGEDVWFTTTNGKLVRTSIEEGGVTDEYDLVEIEQADVPLGWCRGLHLAGDDAYVGYSRLRHTKLRQNLSWIKHGFRTIDSYKIRPTRVVRYNLRTREKVAEWNLEGCGLHTVFSILPLPDGCST